MPFWAVFTRLTPLGTSPCWIEIAPNYNLFDIHSYIILLLHFYTPNVTQETLGSTVLPLATGTVNVKHAIKVYNYSHRSFDAQTKLKKSRVQFICFFIGLKDGCHTSLFLGLDTLWSKVDAFLFGTESSDIRSTTTEEQGCSDIGKTSNQHKESVLVNNDWSGSEERISKQTGVLVHQPCSIGDSNCVSNGSRQKVAETVVVENAVVNVDIGAFSGDRDNAKVDPDVSWCLGVVLVQGTYVSVW